MQNLAEAGIRTDIVVMSLSGSMVKELVLWETGFVADMAGGKRGQHERVNAAVTHFRDALTIAYVIEFAWQFRCKTIGEASIRFGEIFELATKHAGFNVLEVIETWAKEPSRVQRNEDDRRRILGSAVNRDSARSLVQSVLGNTEIDVETLRCAASEIDRLPEIDALLASMRKYVRRTDPFLAQRLEYLAGLGFPSNQISQALGVDEDDLRDLMVRLEVAPARGLHRLPEGAMPAEELAVVDELLPADLSDAHLRWLESGAEGPDPCREMLL